MGRDLLIDVELKIVRGLVSLEEMQAMLNGDVVNNSTAKYVEELICNGVLDKDMVMDMVSKHVAMQENETARLIQQAGEF